MEAQPRLDLIKIDVEGMEADVLRGAGGLIRRHKPVIYAENDKPEKSPELVRLIRSHGCAGTPRSIRNVVFSIAGRSTPGFT